MATDIRIRRSKGEANRLKKFYFILKADRLLELAITLLVAGALLISISGMYITPFVSQQTGTIIITNNPHNSQQGYAGQLNLYAEAPGFPIYMNISDPGHQTLTYTVYFVNDTNLAVGFGPETPIVSGQLTDSVDITIPNTIYHMSYLLKINAPNNTFFDAPVYYSQTVYQYPNANIYLLAPGIISMVGGIILVGMSLINMHSDRDYYYGKLKLRNSEKSYLFKNGGGIRINLPWFAQVITGLLVTAVGFTLFGRDILYSWIGIIFILGGIAYFLNGLVQKAIHR